MLHCVFAIKREVEELNHTSIVEMHASLIGYLILQPVKSNINSYSIYSPLSKSRLIVVQEENYSLISNVLTADTYIKFSVKTLKTVNETVGQKNK